MINRYTRPEMKKIWSQKNRYQTWLKVEILAAEAWSQLGHIPFEDVETLLKKASFDEKRIEEIEAITHHDVVAFTRCLSESLGEEKKWVHYGLTSTDVVDTAQGHQLKQANDVIQKDLEEFLEVLKEKAIQYKETVCMGRTHGVHAEPTTFGLKMARYYAEMKRQMERFEHARKGVEAGKISGAVGTYANVPPFVQDYVCQKLGIRSQEISTQVLPRDLHAEYLSSLALIATSIENIATEIRHLQKSEVREVEEAFEKGQKGSSAMPHKRNPISSENVTGLARVCRGHMVTAYENVALWHERDISHSSAERIILSDTTTLVDYMLCRFKKVVQTLTIFPENMLKNMQATHGLIYSQRLLLKLVDKGLSREEAYDRVQPLTAQSWEQQCDFKDLVKVTTSITQFLSSEEIEDAFDFHYHLRRVDEIYRRMGLME